MKVLLGLGLVVATISPLHAQDGLRSASLPERPVATLPPGPGDLFRAGPDTYRPGTHPDRFGPVIVSGSSYWPYLIVPAPEPPRVIERSPQTRFTRRETAPVPAVPDRRSVLPQSVAPPVPVAAKTMYVIPRCYAGDKPPDASTGCDLTKLRTIR
jgi:hypothetical protein